MRRPTGLCGCATPAGARSAGSSAQSSGRIVMKRRAAARCAAMTAFFSPNALRTTSIGPCETCRRPPTSSCTTGAAKPSPREGEGAPFACERGGRGGGLRSSEGGQSRYSPSPGLPRRPPSPSRGEGAPVATVAVFTASLQKARGCRRATGRPALRTRPRQASPPQRQCHQRGPQAPDRGHVAA